jgi:hypothetical protein
MINKLLYNVEQYLPNALPYSVTSILGYDLN